MEEGRWRSLPEGRSQWLNFLSVQIIHNTKTSRNILQLSMDFLYDGRYHEAITKITVRTKIASPIEFEQYF